MPIGMSGGRSSSLWNPKAKGPLQIKNPMGQNIQSSSPGGMQPSYPPIAASRNMLSKHMQLPNPANNTTPSVPAVKKRRGASVLKRGIF